MANETTSTTLTEVIQREANAASALYFAERPGVTQFVAKKDLTGQPTLAAQFPIYDKVSAAAIAENTDFTTNSALDTSGSVTVTVSEHAIRFIVTDLSIGATVDDIVNPPDMVRAKAMAEGGVAGAAASEAVQRIQDQDVCALFSGFSSSTGSNSGKLTQQLLIDATVTLNQNNVPSDRRVAVLHSKQWGDILPTFDDANTYGAQGAEVIRTGSVGLLYGALIFQTNNVGTATVSASTVYAGCVMHPTAVGLAVKGQMGSIEAERDASLRATELVATGVWGEAKYRGGATTNGRGGAGVELYSNTTA